MVVDARDVKHQASDHCGALGHFHEREEEREKERERERERAREKDKKKTRERQREPIFLRIAYRRVLRSIC